MDIYISPRTAGRYGGGFKGDLRYFDQVIKEYLGAFKSSFDEFWLTLDYPPMYVLPGVVGIENDYKKYYETLPVFRLDRKNKKIEISLKAPEFSEHFDEGEKSNYKHQFEIEKIYENISEPILAEILIDKCIEAASLVNTRLKSEDVFDLEQFKNILSLLRPKINIEFLVSERKRKTDEINLNAVDRAIELREKRKINRHPKDKVIRDFRVYGSRLPEKALYPYDYQYAEIFLNKLRSKGLLCPTYHHLYIQAAKTFEDCLNGSNALENWYVYGLATIDYDSYVKQSDTAKETLVLNTIINGLMDIADIDDLDQPTINSTIDEIKISGLNTELEHIVAENKNHKAIITYFSRSMEDGNPVYLNIIEKSTGRSGKIQIGEAEKDQLYFWISKLTLNNTHVKIKARNPSMKTEFYLKDKPGTMEFSIKEIING